MFDNIVLFLILHPLNRDAGLKGQSPYIYGVVGAEPLYTGLKGQSPWRGRRGATPNLDGRDIFPLELLANILPNDILFYPFLSIF